MYRSHLESRGVDTELASQMSGAGHEGMVAFHRFMLGCLNRAQLALMLENLEAQLARHQDDDELQGDSPPGQRGGSRCRVHEYEQGIVHQVDGERACAQVAQRARGQGLGEQVAGHLHIEQ